jgi:glycosyltransferase involved in cell wall biosynthesis
LILSIDPRAPALRSALLALIEELDIQRQVVVLGSVWEQLPLIYNATSVYCTPSVMEGFGMSAQEAAATGKAVVSSDLVPFAREYLLGEDHVAVPFSGNGRSAEYQLGEAAITVPADRVDGFAAALIHLLTNEDLRRRMGGQALAITIPYFTWMNRSRDLMHDLGMTCDDRT